MALLWLLGPSLAAADARTGETTTRARPAAPKPATQRLRGLDRQALLALSPHLARGPVALVEFASGGALPAINVAVRVRASVAQVLAAISAPERYPSFMGTLDEVKVVSRGPRTVVYDWAWSMAVFRMAGRNVMRIYPPRATSGARVADRPGTPGSPNALGRGARVTVDNQSGDMGTGRTSIRVLPEADGGSLLVVSMRVDLREANYVARQMSRAARSVNRSANMALTYSLVLGLRQQAERTAGTASDDPAPAEGALHAPHVDRRRIEPLLRRGDLVLMDLWAGSPGRVTVLGSVHRGAEVVRGVMLDAEGFGGALIPGSGAEIVSKGPDETVFDWEIGLPLVGISGRMRLRHALPQEVSVHATEGALQGGQWHFHTEPRGNRRSFVLGWARFDLRRSSFWLRQLIRGDHALGHGITAASEVMLMRAIRTRSGKAPASKSERKPARKPARSEAHRRAHARLGR